MNLAVTFFLAFAFSFLGSIPPGTLNLTILRLGMERKMNVAFRFALAAALIEYPYAWLALLFEDWITSSPVIVNNFTLISALVMTTLGILTLRSATRATPDAQPVRESGFRKGLVLSILNPLALPFWIGITAYLKGQGWISLSVAIRVAVAARGSRGAVRRRVGRAEVLDRRRGGRAQAVTLALGRLPAIPEAPARTGVAGVSLGGRTDPVAADRWLDGPARAALAAARALRRAGALASRSAGAARALARGLTTRRRGIGHRLAVLSRSPVVAPSPVVRAGASPVVAGASAGRSRLGRTGSPVSPPVLSGLTLVTPGGSLSALGADLSLAANSMAVSKHWVLASSPPAPLLAAIGLVPILVSVGCLVALKKRRASAGAFVIDADARMFTHQREARYELSQIELGTEIDALADGAPRWLMVHVRGGKSYRIARGYEKDIGALVRLLASWGVTVKIA